MSSKVYGNAEEGNVSDNLHEDMKCRVFTLAK